MARRRSIVSCGLGTFWRADTGSGSRSRTNQPSTKYAAIKTGDGAYLVLPAVDFKDGDVAISVYLVSWRMACFAFQLTGQLHQTHGRTLGRDDIRDVFQRRTPTSYT